MMCAKKQLRRHKDSEMTAAEAAASSRDVLQNEIRNDTASRSELSVFLVRRSPKFTRASSLLPSVGNGGAYVHSTAGCTYTRGRVFASLPVLLTLVVLHVMTAFGVSRRGSPPVSPAITTFPGHAMHSAFLRTSLPSSRGPNRGRRVAFLSALPSTCGKAASTRGSPSGSQPAFSLFGSRASPPSRSASANGAPVQLAAAASSVPSFVFSSFSSPILSGWRPATPFPALSLLSPLLPLGRTVEETVSSSREGTAGRETFLFAQTPGALGADEEGPLPTLTLTQADLDFYRELGVSPKAPWWEVQQAYQLKHSEVEDETQQRKMEEAWLQIFAKRFNRDFLDVCRRYENQHTEESRSRLSKFFAWVFGRRKPASNDIDWDSGFPSEEDPVYMSQVDAPREIKEIMMGLGDRSGVFRDIAKDDDKRRDGLFRRFDIARVWSTGSFFVPLALVSLSSSKLITPALTTAFGLSASFMGKIDTNMGTEGASELKRFSPPTLRTLLWTGGLLLLHAVLGVAGASALLTAIGRLPLGLRPESLVAAMVILQWWFSAVAYRTHESVPVDDDLGDDLDDDPDASEGTRPNMPQDDSDEDSDGDDLSGPLDE